MTLDTSTLIACGVHPTQARVFAPALDLTFIRFDIDTPYRQAAFIAQTSYESGGYVRLEEDLYYRDAARVANLFRTAFDSDRNGSISGAEVVAAQAYVGSPQRLANRAYANRGGNGPESSGDGWRYRGRGPIQLTFKANYAAMSAKLGHDYVGSPELVALPVHGCLVAGQFWANGAMNLLADDGDIDGITCKINGPGMIGAAARRQAFSAALKVLTATSWH